MRRETVDPTPLHAADLQFQAFAEFDGSAALTDIGCPTLLLTGDLDELISPQNSRMMANRISGAELIVIPGCGHRVLWEATDECSSIVARFLRRGKDELLVEPHAAIIGKSLSLVQALGLTLEMLVRWPLTATSATFESLKTASQSVLMGYPSRFGEGKPIILSPGLDGGLNALALSAWLRAIGYRPVTANHDDIGAKISDVTQRLQRKAVLITGVSGIPLALENAKTYARHISDLVVLGPAGSVESDGFPFHKEYQMNSQPSIIDPNASHSDNDVVDWLTNDTRDERFIDNIFAELCIRLQRAGIPVKRASLNIVTYHPQWLGARFLWADGMREVEIAGIDYDVRGRSEYIGSPANELHDGATQVRENLERDRSLGRQQVSAFTA